MADGKLKKDLNLVDVFVICTGAMFSSGFFLLPGIAAAKTGASVPLAYLIAAILVLPAVFSKAELSTAMPKAGGTYYYLDRCLGPMVGTFGGIGTFLALVLKTAFAFVGIGAYASIFIQAPMKPIAIVLTAVFMIFNIIGAKETLRVQGILVVILMCILALFIGDGLAFVNQQLSFEFLVSQTSPFMPGGFNGLIATAGLVIVSFAGLTKVTSVAEEIKNPDKNIPFGMLMSLVITTTMYILGITLMVLIVGAESLMGDLKPVATAAASLFSWISPEVAVGMVVVAAIASFASAGNAGLMSSSRYPFAMAKDRLLPSKVARLGRFKTPLTSILITAFTIMAVILFLDVEGIAKLASAFQLFIFILLNLSVIVMRESHIDSYDPGYTSPFYPWMQIFGMIANFALIIYMGASAIAFTLGITVMGIFWYYGFARRRVVRHGAIFHWFARLGQNQYHGLDDELWQIMREKGLRDDDPFERMVLDAEVLDLDHDMAFEDLVDKISVLLEEKIPATAHELREGFLQKAKLGAMPLFRGVCIPGLRLFGLKKSVMVLARSRTGINVDLVDVHGDHSSDKCIYSFIFLISPEQDSKMHLRILAEIAEKADEDYFLDEWLKAEDAMHLKEAVLRDNRFLNIKISKSLITSNLIGTKLKDFEKPKDILIALIKRESKSIIPNGNTILKEADRMIVIGAPKSIQKVKDQYIDPIPA